MPVTTAAQNVPAIIQWFSTWGNIVYFFANVLWWIITGFAAGWAASVFYRVSKLKMQVYEAKLAEMGASDGMKDAPAAKASSAGDVAKKDDAKATKEKVDVDKFVE